MMVQEKYIGLALAICSTIAIGASFVITKKGLNDAGQRHGFEGDGYAYLRSPVWWGGIITMVLGEIANFAAYAFAPAILVTPLGALSVLIGAVLGAYFLKENLGALGKMGCALCLIGSVIIVLHAPPDKEIETVNEILQYAIHPGKCNFAVNTWFCAELSTRILAILHHSSRLRRRHDLSSGAEIWQEESSHLHLNMFDSRLCVCNVNQGLWYRLEIDSGRQQSIQIPVDLRFRNRDCCLHFNTDELLQQSPKSIFHFNVSSQP